MQYLRSAAIVWFASLMLSPSADAQNAARGWSSTLLVGTLHTTRRDETASPFRFSGRSVAGILTLERRTTHYRFLSELQGASMQLGTGATDTDVQFKTGSFALNALRRIRDSRALQLEAGVETRAGIDVTEHAFSLNGVASTRYRFTALTVAPEIRAATATRWGTLGARLTVPMVGWVDHPYSEVKSAHNAFNPRFASVDKLRRVDAEIGYTTGSVRRVSALIGLRASVLNYNDDLPVRAVTNILSAGFVIGSRGGMR